MRDFLAVVTVAIEQIRSRARILMIISGLSANTRAFLLFLLSQVCAFIGACHIHCFHILVGTESCANTYFDFESASSG